MSLLDALFPSRRIQEGDVVSYTTYDGDGEETTETSTVSRIETKELDGPWFEQEDGSQATTTAYYLEGEESAYDVSELTKETDLHEMSGFEFFTHLLFG